MTIPFNTSSLGSVVRAALAAEPSCVVQIVGVPLKDEPEIKRRFADCGARVQVQCAARATKDEPGPTKRLFRKGP